MSATSSLQAHTLLQRLGVAPALYTDGTLIARSPVDGAVTGRVVESSAADMQAAIGPFARRVPAVACDPCAEARRVGACVR